MKRLSCVLFSLCLALLASRPAHARRPQPQPDCRSILASIAPSTGRVLRREPLPRETTVEKVGWSRLIRDHCRPKESDEGCQLRLERELGGKGATTRVRVFLMGPFSDSYRVTLKDGDRRVTRVYVGMQKLTEELRAAAMRRRPLLVLAVTRLRDPAKRWANVLFQQVTRVKQLLHPGIRAHWKPAPPLTTLADQVRRFELRARANRLRLERLERQLDGTFLVDLRCF